MPARTVAPARGVDPVQPDLVLTVVRVQQRDGVAVMHPHDVSLDLVRTGVRTGDKASQTQRGRPEGSQQQVERQQSSICEGVGWRRYVRSRIDEMIDRFKDKE